MLDKKKFTNPKLENQEVGFGNIENFQQRILNRDGSYNYVRKGISWFQSFSFYHYFISISWIHFLLIIFIWYLFINFIFTGIYYIVGIEHLIGIVFNTSLERYLEVYYFSAQTLTTVGYGRINPIGSLASSVATFEAFVGLLTFALITGLMYARFAKPVAKFIYSKNAIFSPYKDGYALMFRFTNKMNNNLINLKVQITLSMVEINESGNKNRRFYSPLNLERDNILFFPANWTIVHNIDKNSPLFKMSWEEIKESYLEILILVSGFDDVYDNQVHSKHSYNISEMLWKVKFVKMLDTDKSGKPVVDLSKVSLIEKANFNE